jgi:hypothetical protein
MKYVRSLGEIQLLLILIFFITISVHAQEDRNTSTDLSFEEIGTPENSIEAGWVTLGFGRGVHSHLIKGRGLITNLSLLIASSYQKNEHLFSVQWVALANIDEYILRDFSFLYGRGTKVKRTFLAMSGGPSIGGYTPDYDSYSWKTSVGFTVCGQAFVRYSPIGIGLYGFANINKYRSYFGLTLAFQVGKLY